MSSRREREDALLEWVNRYAVPMFSGLLLLIGLALASVLVPWFKWIGVPLILGVAGLMCAVILGKLDNRVQQ